MLRKITALALLTAALITGCGDDDNPVDADHDADHAEALGLVLRQSGAEIARYQDGQLEGRIEVGRDKETPLLTVRFIAEDGDLFAPDHDAGFALDWELADAQIAAVEQHAEDGPWAFHLVGLAVGTTTLTLKLNHNNHADFVALPIDILVAEDGPGEPHED